MATADNCQGPVTQVRDHENFASHVSVVNSQDFILMDDWDKKTSSVSVPPPLPRVKISPLGEIFSLSAIDLICPLDGVLKI